MARAARYAAAGWLNAMLRCRQIHSDSAQTVRVIESVEILQARKDTGCRAYVRIEPVAVVVTDGDREYACGVDGQAIDSNQWQQMMRTAEPAGGL